MSEEETSPQDKPGLNLTDEETFDQSRRAEAVLGQILETEFSPQGGVEQGKKMTVSEAIAARPVIDQDTGRTQARVLIVTTNEEVLERGSLVRSEYIKLASQFDELHIMCVISRQGKESFDRAGNNIWFYKVHSKNWWTLPWAAKRAAVEALTWNSYPRPDIIVGVDPFEAGLAARLIAKKFKRPLQYHILTDPFDPEYEEASPDNNWRIRLAKFLLKRAGSVRTKTKILKESLSKKYKKLKDIAVLPRFYNFTNLLNNEPAFTLHEKYKELSFIMITFGPLTANSHLHDVFAALNRLLHNPRIGLVVVGDGPAKEVFLEKVKILGIEKNVIFHKSIDDLVSYLKTADLLVEMSPGEEGEIRVLQAAAAGLPAVMVSTDLRKDLFKDGESGFLCEPGDIPCMSEKTSKFINTAALREQFSDNAIDVAKERLHEDPEAHYQAWALSIESVLAQEG